MSKLSESLFVICIGVVYIINSTALISFNSYLMNENRFPYSICLVTMHMTTCFIISLITYFLFPSLYPSLTEVDPTVKREKIVKAYKVLLPIAIAFSGTLVLSNEAYKHLSVAFIQMLKESNVIWIYTLSLLIGLDRWNWPVVKILLVLLIATFFTIVGELRFTLLGFIIQFSSGLCESFNIVLKSKFLTKEGLNFDPLTFILLLSPLCLCVLAIKMLIFQFHWQVWEAVVVHWPLLLANCLVAFSLNLVIAIFLKNARALSFVVSGYVKDLTIVISTATLFGTQISLMQGMGFFAQLIAVAIYSSIRNFPHHYEGAFLTGIQNSFNELIYGPLKDVENPEEESLLKNEKIKQIEREVAESGESSTEDTTSHLSKSDHQYQTLNNTIGKVK